MNAGRLLVPRSPNGLGQTRTRRAPAGAGPRWPGGMAASAERQAPRPRRARTSIGSVRRGARPRPPRYLVVVVGDEDRRRGERSAGEDARDACRTPPPTMARPCPDRSPDAPACSLAARSPESIAVDLRRARLSCLPSASVAWARITLMGPRRSCASLLGSVGSALSALRRRNAVAHCPISRRTSCTSSSVVNGLVTALSASHPAATSRVSSAPERTSTRVFAKRGS